MDKEVRTKAPQGLSPDSMAVRAVGFSGLAELTKGATRPAQTATEADLLNTETLMHEIDVHYSSLRPLGDTIDLTFIEY